MELSISQKSNIRHFVFYLINGTLNFELIDGIVGNNYHEKLANHPEVFYRTCCVFVNQEFHLAPEWPEVNKLAEFVCRSLELDKSKHLKSPEDWELNPNWNAGNWTDAFKEFSYRISIGHEAQPIYAKGNYNDYILEGASFLERAFAIWSNVIRIENGTVSNQQNAIERVSEYIKSYYERTESNLEDWEIALH